MNVKRNIKEKIITKEEAKYREEWRRVAYEKRDHPEISIRESDLNTIEHCIDTIRSHKIRMGFNPNVKEDIACKVCYSLTPSCIRHYEHSTGQHEALIRDGMEGLVESSKDQVRFIALLVYISFLILGGIVLKDHTPESAMYEMGYLYFLIAALGLFYLIPVIIWGEMISFEPSIDWEFEEAKRKKELTKNIAIAWERKKSLTKNLTN